MPGYRARVGALDTSLCPEAMPHPPKHCDFGFLAGCLGARLPRGGHGSRGHPRRISVGCFLFGASELAFGIPHRWIRFTNASQALTAVTRCIHL